ncbi:MAG: hypothetical protein A2W90_07115 [Bacteroidetes bacterium GWF2_42_66]|nr:MAG: hypothetical protein A2W92_01545 [Bacteroidetes bacterium GWA2_42_15]OFY02910.1 MAG: hypothetical protein A2W89_24520 [Bacteroidetes bacterium GWE2_42_39]OFY44565.1 MAG: hypothetical protein A2W90_07115 [Bacteroidetes bacterium GWF2_42_66]HBL74876.1 hypothetical protein [Prolixibacteraceae bacterium]HCR91725.1 hypothetical protein [Prolixibacteraceae bacterium]
MSINDNWNNEWVPFSIFSVSAASLLYIGSAFPALRSREKTINFLMIPASPFEKFLYEFIERIVLFCVLFPILLYLFGNLALGIVHEIKQSIGDNFPSEYLSYQKIFKDVVPADAVSIIVLGVLAAFSIAFAGTIVFRKLPLIKTIIFVGVVFLVVVGYCILIFEEMKLNFPWIEPFFRGKSKAEVFSLFAVLLLIFNLIILSYAFFKLKEKEVS